MGDDLIHVDVSQIVDLEKIFREAGDKAPLAISRSLNRAGDMAKTKVSRALVPQTGLKKRVIHKAIKSSKASPGHLSYQLSARGGNISLKYFGARETLKGVSAAPWGKRKVYPSTFIKGGLFPKRVAFRNLGGHVFKRVGKKRNACFNAEVWPVHRKRDGIGSKRRNIHGHREASSS